MQEVFFIFGYGIPKDILKDFSYNRYLSLAFNYIYNQVGADASPLVICSGGETDFFEPYDRSEAEEMLRWLNHHRKQPFLKTKTSQWELIAEKTSLSTLENLLNCRKILETKKMTKSTIGIFCEYTRRNRITTLAQQFLSTPYVSIIPIDFDTSENRYLDPAFIRKKENKVLEFDLWSQKSPANFKKYHQLYVEKMAFIRNNGPRNQEQSLQQWWQQSLNQLLAE